MTRSASPSKASPRSAWCATTDRASSSGSVEPHLSLMFAPSGASCSALTSAPSVGQHLGCDGARRAVGAVDDDVQAVEAAALERGDEMRLVELDGTGGVGTDAAHAVAGRAARAGGRGRPATASSSRSISLSTSTGSFVPNRLNSLIPLSPKGLCEAEITAPGAWRGLGHGGHARGGQHAEIDHVGPLGGQAGGEGGLEERSRAAGVAADDERRGGQACGRRRARGPGPARVSALRSQPRAHRRCRSGPAPFATAWSTAAPCGPS